MEKSIKTYSELILLPTRIERLQYLMLYQRVGDATFGYDRYLNQMFYNSHEWKEEFRDKIIVRDKGFDLALPGYPLGDRPAFVHHLNPITKEDILNRSPMLFDEENVVLVSKKTHDIIHYAFSLEGIEMESFAIRRPNDTKLW